jgi:ABC-2 type transport system permease protein
MIDALVYLQATSFKNTLRERLRRLRQPRYLFGALAGAAYFYFFFFRHVVMGNRGAQASVGDPGEFQMLFTQIGALALFVYIALAWIVPSGRAALAFSEPEVAFLFPAPVSRHGLLHYKLLKNQLAILISALFMSLVARRGLNANGSFWTHAAGWWLASSLIQLHTIAAGFTRERLVDLGINARTRRYVALALLILLGAATLYFTRESLPGIPEITGADLQPLVNFGREVLSTPPLGWVLWPFRIAVRPLFAGTPLEFAHAVWPVLVLIALHYLWAVKSVVAFEEASVAESQRLANARAAMRAGKLRVGGPKRVRREPFKLGAAGQPLIAFLWRGLLSFGPAYYLRNWLILYSLVLGAMWWITSDPLYHPYVMVSGIVFSVIGAYGIFLGPIFFRRASQQMLERIDIFKAYPLRGWQIVAGELFTPTVLLSALEWLAIAVVGICLGRGHLKANLTPDLVASAAVGLSLLVPPLSALLFSINFAAVLLFPAWAGTSHAGAPGVEVMGQRLITFAGFVVICVVALLPAAILGGLVLVPLHLLLGRTAVAILAGSVVASATVAAELAAFLWWLGRRYEKFDVSVDLPRSAS